MDTIGLKPIKYSPEETKQWIKQLDKAAEKKKEYNRSQGIVEYNPEEIEKKLRELIEYLNDIDDAGSRDHAFGALQEYFTSIEPILDEYGGI